MTENAFIYFEHILHLTNNINASNSLSTVGRYTKSYTPPPFFNSMSSIFAYLGHHDKIWTWDMVCSYNIGNWKVQMIHVTYETTKIGIRNVYSSICLTSKQVTHHRAGRRPILN